MCTTRLASATGGSTCSRKPSSLASGSTAATTASFSRSCTEHVEYTSRCSAGKRSAWRSAASWKFASRSSRSPCQQKEHAVFLNRMFEGTQHMCVPVLSKNPDASTLAASCCCWSYKACWRPRQAAACCSCSSLPRQQVTPGCATAKVAESPSCCGLCRCRCTRGQAALPAHLQTPAQLCRSPGSLSAGGQTYITRIARGLRPRSVTCCFSH